MDLDLGTIKSRCRTHWKKGEGINGPVNYLKLSAKVAVKIASIFCVAELQAELS